MPVGEADADEGDEIEEAGHAQQGVEPTLVLHTQKYGDKTKATVGINHRYRKTIVVDLQWIRIKFRIRGFDGRKL